MTELSDLPRPVMGRRAGLHSDKAWRELAEKLDDLTATKLPREDDLAGRVDAVQLKEFLARSMPMVLACMWTTPLK